jgi:hypothetical protein
MDKHYACYCGLYCDNCAIKVKVFPAAKTLYDEMRKAGFDDVVNSIPGGGGFWTFLKDIAENWICTSCRDGSGNPGCQVRVCAQEKGVEMCALCECYPCERIDNFDEGYPVLKNDNALLRDEGWDAWGRLQDDRRACGFTYSHENE